MSFKNENICKIIITVIGKIEFQRQRCIIIFITCVITVSNIISVSNIIKTSGVVKAGISNAFGIISITMNNIRIISHTHKIF